MKRKWEVVEEVALSAGVRKHGQGKWKKILDDPNFSPFLSHRSNVHLKDKWRNMNDRAKEINIDLLINEENRSPAALSDDDAEIFIGPKHRKAVIRYKKVIFEALLATKDPKGSGISDIVKFIEQRHEVPKHFRRSLRSHLRSLVSQGQLEKAHNCYRIKIKGSKGKKTPTPKKQGKRQKLGSQEEPLEAEENDSSDSDKLENEPVTEEDVGVLQQVVQGIYGRCKKAISWSPFSSISRNEY